MTTEGKPEDAVDSRLLRLRDVAERLSVSPSMAHKLVASKTIASLRIGRAVRVRPSDLERFLEDAARDD